MHESALYLQMFDVLKRLRWLRVIAWVFLCSAFSAAQMVSIPGGSYVRGGSGGEEDELPARTVTLDAFAMDRHEVSFASYDSCVQAGACSPAHYDDGKCIIWTASGIQKVRVPKRFRSPEYPVVCVDWRQARAYCRFRGKRLPTETEWEYAASSGGKEGRYAWGDAVPDTTRCTRAATQHPRKSGSFPANDWGLYDMTGNVWEWTEDRYLKDNYEHTDGTNPKGPPVGRYRAVRGGGWYSTPQQLRIRNRQWFVPEYGEVSIGFRCVK